MTEKERKLLHALRDANDNGQLEWGFDDDRREFHAKLSVSGYVAVMRYDEKFVIDIRDSSGKFIDSIKPSVVMDRAIAQHVYSIAHSSTSRTDEIFSGIIEVLKGNHEKD